jgi:hypothetical protein
MGMMTASMYITGANILLLCSLLVVYVRNLRKVGSTFTVGLLLFAALLLVQNVVSFYFYATMMPYFAAGLEGYVLTFNALQLGAFVILNYLTWK